MDERWEQQGNEILGSYACGNISRDHAVRALMKLGLDRDEAEEALDAERGYAREDHEP